MSLLFSAASRQAGRQAAGSLSALRTITTWTRNSQAAEGVWGGGHEEFKGDGDDWHLSHTNSEQPASQKATEMSLCGSWSHTLSVSGEKRD